MLKALFFCCCVLYSSLFGIVWLLVINKKRLVDTDCCYPVYPKTSSFIRFNSPSNICHLISYSVFVLFVCDFFLAILLCSVLQFHPWMLGHSVDFKVQICAGQNTNVCAHSRFNQHRIIHIHITNSRKVHITLVDALILFHYYNITCRQST